jgi:hypothetical protein
MLKPLFRILQALALFAALAGNAHATFHLGRMTQFYSNADGSVQSIEHVPLASGQQFLSNHTITASSGSVSHSFTFTTDLPGDSAMASEGGFYGGGMSFKSMVIATQGFADLNILKPDYVVPTGFSSRRTGASITRAPTASPTRRCPPTAGSRSTAMARPPSTRP